MCHQIEHVLCEWGSGVRPSVPQMFSEEVAKTRYLFYFILFSFRIEFIYIISSSYVGFEEAWNQIAAGSPTWKTQWPRKLYQTIVYVFIVQIIK